MEDTFEPSVTFKIICMGAGGVGKSSLCERYDKGTFSADYKLTIGTGFFIKDILLENGVKVKIQVWDLGGQQRFMPLHGPYVMGAHGALLVFSITSQDSLRALIDWYNLFKTYSDNHAQMCLVSTKHDLHKKDWQVSNEQIRNFMEKNQISEYANTSAKEDWNVSTPFQKIAELLATVYQI
ncbi:MAG: Rab family GTPase [Promethearchaeota archaeon]